MKHVTAGSSVQLLVNSGLYIQRDDVGEIPLVCQKWVYHISLSSLCVNESLSDAHGLPPYLLPLPIPLLFTPSSPIPSPLPPSAVMFLRFLTSCEIQRNADFYLPFLIDIPVTHGDAVLAPEQAKAVVPTPVLQVQAHAHKP